LDIQYLRRIQNVSSIHPVTSTCLVREDITIYKVPSSSFIAWGENIPALQNNRDDPKRRISYGLGVSEIAIAE
jgi:hypothetical protein